MLSDGPPESPELIDASVGSADRSGGHRHGDLGTVVIDSDGELPGVHLDAVSRQQRDKDVARFGFVASKNAIQCLR